MEQSREEEICSLKKQVDLLTCQIEYISTMLPSFEILKEKLNSISLVTDISTVESMEKKFKEQEERHEKLSSQVDKLSADHNELKLRLKLKCYASREPDILSSIEKDIIEHTDMYKQSNYDELAERTGILYDRQTNLKQQFDVLHEKVHAIPNLTGYIPHWIKKDDVEDPKNDTIPSKRYVQKMIETSIPFRTTLDSKKKCLQLEVLVKKLEMDFKCFQKKTQSQIGFLQENYNKLNDEIKTLNTIFNNKLIFIDPLRELRRKTANQEKMKDKETNSQLESGNEDEIIQINEEQMNKVDLPKKKKKSVDTYLRILLEDIDNKNELIKRILNDISEIQMTKLDKQAVKSSMNEKADTILVNNKVSYDHFDETMNAIFETITALELRIPREEDITKNVTEDIGPLLEKKWDKADIHLIEEFIDDKCKDIIEKTEKFIKKELNVEAVRRKLVGNFKCISCNAEGFMSADNVHHAFEREFTFQKVVTPHLYAGLSQIEQKKRSPRYCGGSITITGPRTTNGNLSFGTNKNNIIQGKSSDYDKKLDLIADSRITNESSSFTRTSHDQKS